jgi:hypothetical protein
MLSGMATASKIFSYLIVRYAAYLVGCRLILIGLI